MTVSNHTIVCSVASLVRQTHTCAIAQREQLSIAYIFYHYTNIIMPL